MRRDKHKGSHPSPVFALELGDELPLLFVGIQRAGEVCGDPLLLSLWVKQETSRELAVPLHDVIHCLISYLTEGE